MRAVYYRLYTKGGPLESNNPIFSNDRFISRISSKSVRPPHTAASLKRYVCKIEGVEGPEKADLYLSLSENKPLDESARLALRGNSGGPGSSEADPVVFVVDKGAVEKRPKSASNAGSSELPAGKNELYGALCGFVLKNFKTRGHQCITDYTTMMAKLSRKRRLTRTTPLWVALTHLSFRHRAQSLRVREGGALGLGRRSLGWGEPEPKARATKSSGMKSVAAKQRTTGAVG
jgi:hypothetical protein